MEYTKLTMSPGRKNLIENIPEDITPKDDAFHGSIKRLAAEWWYFDAIFDKGYAIHIGCMTFSKKKRGNVSQVLEIYKDGKLIFGERKKHKFKHFKTSKKIPLVKIDNNDFIRFNQEKYKKNGQWIYNVSIKIDEYEAVLTFKVTTKGWKIETDKESWTVAAPKAEVTGKLILNGKKIDVKGVGYHDHNWNYTLLTLLTYGKGWYWGRIMTENYNLIFANIIKSRSKSVLLSVINVDKNGYLNVKPENIDFKLDKTCKIKRKKVPSRFKIQIDSLEGEKPIKVDVLLDTKQIHYERRLLFMSYFRFHEKSRGYISVNGKKEKVGNVQIMELLKFR